MFELVMLVATAIVVGLVLGPRYLRTRRALREPIGGDSCVACSSTDVETFAPECFRCNACRFTWGDGLKEHAERERQAAIERLSPEERRRLAIGELEEAAARLVAALASLEHASRQLGPDLLAGGGYPNGDMYSRARSEGLVVAAREMGLAQKHVRVAAQATGGCIEGAGEPIDFSSRLFGLDVFFDSVIIDVASHLEVRKLRKQAEDMQAGVTQALAALRAGEADAS